MFKRLVAAGSLSLLAVLGVVPAAQADEVTDVISVPVVADDPVVSPELVVAEDPAPVVTPVVTAPAPKYTYARAASRGRRIDWD